MGTPRDCTPLTCPVPDGFVSSPPSLAGNIVFIAAFSLLIPVNLFTGIRFETPLNSSCLIVGLALEVLGYVGRLLLGSDRSSTLYFVLYLVGVNAGPVFLTTAIFLILPHIVVLYGKQFTLISRPVYFAAFFIAFGAITLTLQVVGAALTATGGSHEEVSPGTASGAP